MPSASAGTEVDPELVDPRGDYDPPLSPYEDGDILALWLGNQTLETFNITLLLARLDKGSRSESQIFVNWSHSGPFTNGYGSIDLLVRSTVSVRWGCGSKPECVSWSIPRRADVEWGSPGRIVIMMDRWGEYPNGTTLYDFEVTVRKNHLHTSLEPDRIVDRAKGNGSFRIIVPPAELPRIPMVSWPLPRNGTEAFDPDEPYLHGLFDLRASRVRFEENNVTLALEMEELSEALLRTCKNWEGKVRIFDYDSRNDLFLDWGLSRDFRGESFRDLELRGMGTASHEVPIEFGLLYGKPGYVSARFARSDWGAEPLGINYSHQAQLNCAGNYDSIDVTALPSYTSAPSILTSILIGLLAMVLCRRQPNS